MTHRMIGSSQIEQFRPRSSVRGVSGGPIDRVTREHGTQDRTSMVSESLSSVIEVIDIDDADPGQERVVSDPVSSSAVPGRHERGMSVDFVSVNPEEDNSMALVTIAHIDRSNTPSEPPPRAQSVVEVVVSAPDSIPRGRDYEGVPANADQSSRQGAHDRSPALVCLKLPIVQPKRKRGRPRRATVAAPKQAQPVLPTLAQVEPFVEETAVKAEGDDIEGMASMMTRSKRVS